MLMWTHKFNSEIERFAHEILGCLAAATGAALVAELVVTSDLQLQRLPLVRALFTCLQGTWFVTVTIVFWTSQISEWLVTSNAGLVLLFCWQVVLLLCAGVCVYLCCSNRWGNVHADTSRHRDSSEQEGSDDFDHEVSFELNAVETDTFFPS
eukprot:TRINITY_DN13303_c0_g1_i2.p1 TRINITY_DN13303_c0_g1~~TRINITY_DN13303_c0_g1_i2.p1  ORF type:complete len:152 (+),score=22.87 TRINITY_DN13303_c0_g1_i2:532-987(+)